MYKRQAQEYTLEKVSEITGLNPDDIYEAAKLYATNGPACTNYSASAIVHHINGFNSHRAILCLSALTGNFDRVGGNYPIPASYLRQPAGFKTRDEEFRNNREPSGTPRIGAGRFPLWDTKFNEFQTMDLMRQMEEETPYPVKAVFALGLNAKLFPETDRLLDCLLYTSRCV